MSRRKRLMLKRIFQAPHTLEGLQSVRPKNMKRKSLINLFERIQKLFE